MAESLGTSAGQRTIVSMEARRAGTVAARGNKEEQAEWEEPEVGRDQGKVDFWAQSWAPPAR